MEGWLILFEALFKKINHPGTRNPTVGREIDSTLFKDFLINRKKPNKCGYFRDQ